MNAFKASFRPKRPVLHKTESGDSQHTTLQFVDMDNFCADAQRSLWHAYNMLTSPTSSLAQTSQLKVITFNVGGPLGFEKAEEILNCFDAKEMDFSTFFSILKSEIFDKLSTDANASGRTKANVDEFHRVCFTFCTFRTADTPKNLSEDSMFKLWKVFNFLVDEYDDEQPIYPLCLDREEVQYVLKWFIEITGQVAKVKDVKGLSENDKTSYSFQEFLQLFEKEFIGQLSETELSEGMQNIYDGIVLDILKKGKMWKRGHQVKNWKERWMVLTPQQLRYYTSSNEKELKGCIDFDDTCKIEILPERHGNHKPNRFALVTSHKPYEMSAHDLKTKNEWISAFQVAIDHAGKKVHLQKQEAKKRCVERMLKKKLIEEQEQKKKEEAELSQKRQMELEMEKKKRMEDEELLRSRLKELEDERKARAEAEARLAEEHTLREAEQQKLRELEQIKRDLERLLEEERQAKKDEEIVRALQARILEEEFQKREELEKIKNEQEQLLQAEREHRFGLESERTEHERKYREAQERLRQLELERAEADRRLQDATEKIKSAENERSKMEQKVKLWKTPVGLARQIQPTISPFVTHRGRGAFTETEFEIKMRERLNMIDDTLAMARNNTTEDTVDSHILDREEIGLNEMHGLCINEQNKETCCKDVVDGETNINTDKQNDQKTTADKVDNMSQEGIEGCTPFDNVHKKHVIDLPTPSALDQEELSTLDDRKNKVFACETDLEKNRKKRENKKSDPMYENVAVTK
ncbi:hypothetical protein ACJMK2_012361 [Sinanodonta woodiana]|uniref:PH domain-containing protein n=1 Tax=Sinanodonta woodiana TaxID=1069815 RepID=A0ABD3V801_SINWO